jgi:hypothetical protein
LAHLLQGLLLRRHTLRTKAVRGASCAAYHRELPITQIEERKGRRGRKAEKQRREELRGREDRSGWEGAPWPASTRI